MYPLSSSLSLLSELILTLSLSLFFLYQSVSVILSPSSVATSRQASKQALVATFDSKNKKK
jgi:hypothetical protein